MTDTTYHIKVMVPGLAPKYFNVKPEVLNSLKKLATLEGCFKVIVMRTYFIEKKKISVLRTIRKYIHPDWHFFSEEEEDEAWGKIHAKLLKEDLGLSEDGLNRKVDATFRDLFGMDRGEKDYPQIDIVPTYTKK